jgi:superfamily II DNA/RNA helicase
MPMKNIMQDRTTAKANPPEIEAAPPAVSLLLEELLQILASNRDHILETGDDPVRFHGYIPPLIGENMKVRRKPTLILAPSDEEVREIADYSRLLQPRKGGLGAIVTIIGTPSKTDRVRTGAYPEILLGTPERIIDNLRRGALDIADIGRVIIDCPGANDFSGFAANVQFIYSRTGIKPQTIILVGEIREETEGLSRLLRRPRIVQRFKFLDTQEISTVSSKKNENPKDDSALNDLIETVIRKVKDEENPQDLNYYKRIIKRNVSFFDRSYFAAYLLKQRYEDTGGDKGRRPEIKSPRRSDMTTLFFGLGKNRKVFPRDITGLISEVPQIEKEHIGEIKILDNYSFVEIAESQAQKVIDALNGVNFRGRKVIVNFARKKDDSGSGNAQGAIG